MEVRTGGNENSQCRPCSSILIYNLYECTTYLEKKKKKSIFKTNPRPGAQRLHCALWSLAQGGCPLRGCLVASPSSIISPEQGEGTSRSVSGDRRQAMQASMASCQGSSGASGKSTSCIRILGSGGGEAGGERYAASLRDPLVPCPAPPPHLRTVKCRGLLAAGVARLRISVRKGWGCRCSWSKKGLISVSWGPPELRACSRSRKVLPGGPQPSISRRRGVSGYCVGGSFPTGRWMSQELAVVGEVSIRKGQTHS